MPEKITATQSGTRSWRSAWPILAERLAARVHEADQIGLVSVTVIGDAVDDAEQDGERRLDEEAQRALAAGHLDHVLSHAAEATAADGIG